MRHHYKVREGEVSLQYVDVMSLYPYVCKYFKFPVGHPVIHVNETCEDREAMLQNEGLIDVASYLPRDSTIQCCLIVAIAG